MTERDLGKISHVNPITLADLPLRDELVGEQPYRAPTLKVPVPLNVNENPYPPSPAIRREMARAVAEAAETLNRYPDREALGLRKDLAHYIGFGVDSTQVWAANGSNEVMVQILQVFAGPGRTVLGFTPTYSMYPEYARNTHSRYVTAERNRWFGLDVDDAVQAINGSHASVVLIATPNNPTGTAIPVSVIDEICERTTAMIVVDEAYQEFSDAPDDSAIALLPKHGRLIVVRTLSKAFALAGGRVGYAVAAPAVVDALRVIRLPYHLSAPTQAVARVALSHAPQMLDKVAELRITRDETATWLARHGLDAVPSQANFVLFGRFADRHSVFTTLLERGVLVREVGPEGYLRVSAGTPEQMSEFRAAMIEVISTSPRLPAGPSDAGHGDPGPRTTDSAATRDPSPVPGGHDD